MRAKPLPVTPVSFEKLFAALAASRALRFQSRYGKMAKGVTDWRQLACAALQRNSLGDLLRRAIDALSTKHREVLFLQDVKTLNTEETAWLLDMSAATVRSLLRRARAQVRDALSSTLFPQPVVKISRRRYSRVHTLPSDFRLASRGNSFQLA